MNNNEEETTLDQPTQLKPIIDGDLNVTNWEEFSQKTNWIIVGQQDAPGGKKVNINRFVGWNKNSKYTGSMLREIRRKQAGL